MGINAAGEVMGQRHPRIGIAMFIIGVATVASVATLRWLDKLGTKLAQYIKDRFFTSTAEREINRIMEPKK
jgi:hypothetical protein